MKTFKEWVDLKNEMYGMEDENTERFHNELIGIREVLKNYLAEAHLKPQPWGELMRKCTTLKQKYPNHERQFNNIYYYVESIADLMKPYVEKLSYGRKYSDPNMRQEYEGISGAAYPILREIERRINVMMGFI